MGSYGVVEEAGSVGLFKYLKANQIQKMIPDLELIVDNRRGC